MFSIGNCVFILLLNTTNIRFHYGEKQVVKVPFFMVNELLTFIQSGISLAQEKQNLDLVLLNISLYVSTICGLFALFVDCCHYLWIVATICGLLPLFMECCHYLWLLCRDIFKASYLGVVRHASSLRNLADFHFAVGVVHQFLAVT